MLIYIGALAMLHPALGVMALVFAALQCALALFGHQRRTVSPATEAGDVGRGLGRLPAQQAARGGRHQDRWACSARYGVATCGCTSAMPATRPACRR
ncbi:MAG: hypothetical protein MZW92_07055 [Comamonadaceae bacterium]|nr:hypothetical protein [Comamonadaceae bacterium]